MSYLSQGPNTFQVPMELFALNRQRLSEKLRKVPNIPSKSFVVLQGGQTLNRYDTDVETVFRQESFFHWAFGVIEPDFYGAIEVATGTTHLFIPHFPESYGVWMGKIFDREHYKKKYGVHHVHFVGEMMNVLSNAQAEVLLILKGLNTDSNLWAREAVFDGMSKFKIDTQILHPAIVEW